VEIKLRSAVITGWDPCSGWDYEIRKPKPFRKLAKPGSVYLVELKNPEESLKLIGALHGESICSEGSTGEKDGYGQVIIAGCNPETIERI
jgi:CRISPR-associated protein Cmr3